MKRKSHQSESDELSSSAATRRSIKQVIATIKNETPEVVHPSVSEEQQPGVAIIFDRKINIQELGESASVYELCRAWVHDDPDRPKARVAAKHISRIRPLSSSTKTKYDSVISYLSNALRKPREEGFTAEHINSLDGIAARDILSLHVLHFKKKRKIHRTLALAMRGRRAALNDTRVINFPLHELIERLAKSSENNEDLQNLMNHLNNGNIEVVSDQFIKSEPL